MGVDEVRETLFEVQDLVSLAESQFRWPDLVGHYTDPDLVHSKLGMLLFTEAHLEYNPFPSVVQAALVRWRPLPLQNA